MAYITTKKTFGFKFILKLFLDWLPETLGGAIEQESVDGVVLSQTGTKFEFFKYKVRIANIIIFFHDKEFI